MKNIKTNSSSKLSIWHIFDCIVIAGFSFIVSGCAVSEGKERLKNSKTYEFNISEQREMPKGLNGKIFVNEYKGICYIIFHGVITSDTNRAFKLASDDLDKRNCDEREVIIESNGGNVSSAIEMGRTIRAKGYTTSLAIGGEVICDSSCGLLFISGKRRFMGLTKGATDLIGFHQTSFLDKDGKRTCVDPSSNRNNNLKAYVMDMLNPTAAELFIKSAMETDCNDIKRLSTKELIDVGIATNIQSRALEKIWF